MQIDDIRHANLLILINSPGGIAELAKKLGHKNGTQISQWKNRSPDSKTGKPRAISTISARRIESALKKELGWMDHDHSSASEPSASTAPKPHPDIQRLLDLTEQMTDTGLQHLLIDAEHYVNKYPRQKHQNAKGSDASDRLPGEEIPSSWRRKKHKAAA